LTFVQLQIFFEDIGILLQKKKARDNKLA